jgi:hypothetical protein
LSRGKSRSEGRREPRAWLGPPSQGGERLARAFGIGSPAKPDVGRMLDDLRTSLMRLEEEVDELGWIVQHTISGPARSEHGRPPPVELPHVPQTTDRDYWLSRCEYFTVYAGERVVGTVEGMRFRSRVDRPDLLEVRCGHLGRRLLLIPDDDVELVKPEERLIALHGPGPIPNGGLLRRRLRLDRLRTSPRALLH